MMFEHGVRFFPGSSAFRARIGSYSAFNCRVTLTTATIGRYCSIGHNTEFGLGSHNVSRITTSSSVTNRGTFRNLVGRIPDAVIEQETLVKEETSQVTLVHDLWAGCHCLFPKSVTIGHGAVIGAGSIITHDVPPYAIVAGAGGGANSKGIIKGYRFSDEVISDLLELTWWNYDHYDLPQMMVQGIKVPISNIKDFIKFMRNEEREHLIALPSAWYYLHVQNANSVQIFRVDPEQTNMGSLLEPATIAVLEEHELAVEKNQANA